MPAQPSADVAAALLAAGLLPCVTRQMTRMGAGSDGGLAWFPQTILAGTWSTLAHALLHGHLGQVGSVKHEDTVHGTGETRERMCLHAKRK